MRAADIIIEHPEWIHRSITLRVILRNACRAVLDNAGILHNVNLSILCTHDAQLRALNHDYRGKDKPTNVLAFPNEEFTSPLRGEVGAQAPGGGEGGAPSPDLTPTLALPPQGGGDFYLGDIAISMDTLAREAMVQGKRLEDHLTHLTIHAVLHLLGFDHENPQEAKAMETKEITILQRLGIANPYG